MIIAVESGLNSIKSELSKRGYDTVDYEGCNFPVDAIIYKSIHLKQCDDLCFLNSTNSNGILMVCANNKSFDEIDNILKTRVYGPLF